MKNFLSLTLALALMVPSIPLPGMYSEARAFSGLVTFDQTYTDQNGGNLEVGDRLTVSVTYENVWINPLNDPYLTTAFPQGTEYVPGTYRINGNLTDDSLLVDDIVLKSVHYQPTMASGEQVTVSFDVVISDSPMYMVDLSSSPVMLYEVDKSTGNATFIDSVDGQTGWFEMALSSDMTTLYGDNINHEIYTYNLLTKQVTKAFDPPVASWCIDFDLSGNMVFVAPDGVFTVNPSTGETLSQFPLSGDPIGAWADTGCAMGADNQMYISINNNATGTGRLWTVNPTTGEVTIRGDISDTETFSGLTISNDGTMYGMGTATDSLWQINKDTAAGTSVGSFNAPIWVGAMTQAGGQKMVLKIFSSFADLSGNTDADNTTIGAVLGDAPAVGGGTYIPPIVPDGICKHVATQTCDFPANFRQDMIDYAEGVIKHHSDQVLRTMGAEIEIAGLTDAAQNTFTQDASAIDTAAKAAWLTELTTMIDQWITANQGQPFCEHRSNLQKLIQQRLTALEAVASREVRELTSGGAAPECHLSSSAFYSPAGEDVYLGWSARNGASYELEVPGFGVVTSPDDAMKINPEEDTFAKMNVLDGGGNVVDYCEYKINVNPACIIHAESTAIELGETIQLFYNGTKNDSVSIDNGIGLRTNLKGGVAVTPTANTTYTMTVTKGGIPTTCSVDVKVYPVGSAPVCADVE